MARREKILNLRPTQFAIGMLEVDEKLAEVRRLKKKDFKKYVEDTPVPVVISPHGELYVVDHHHFLMVCHLFGVKKVKVEVREDLSRSKMSYVKFWKYMFKQRNAYPYCQFGEGPREALYLPKDVRGLADDPYRSLAWFVRKAGAFANSEKNFAEFQWANFFRSKKLLDRYGPRGMPEALKKASRLAQSKAAARLPGYGKLHLDDFAKVEKKVKKKASRLVAGA